MDSWLLTISPPQQWNTTVEQFEGLFQALQDIIGQCQYVVLEQGHTQEHLHMHAVFTTREPLDRAHLLSAIVTRVLRTLPFPPPKPTRDQLVKKAGNPYPYLIKLDKVYDLPTLIAGYLDKEDGVQILGSPSGYDLEQLRQEAEAKAAIDDDLTQEHKRVSGALISVKVNHLAYLIDLLRKEEDPERNMLHPGQFDNYWMQLQQRGYGLTSLLRYRSDVYNTWQQINNISYHTELESDDRAAGFARAVQKAKESRPWDYSRADGGR